jgi:hypothetical protein
MLRISNIKLRADFDPSKENQSTFSSEDPENFKGQKRKNSVF